MDIQGKTVLLTGASGGIGGAIATHLAARGARLIITGRNGDKLQQLQAQLIARHPQQQIIAVVADIGSGEGRASLVESCAAQAVDIAIFNAGVMDFALFARQNPEAVTGMIQLNLLAPMLLSQALLPLLQKRPKTAMVFVGSTFGSIGHPGFSAYCASKFGLRGFAESLRRELADTAIAVHYLAPRATKTPLNSPIVDELNKTLGNSSDDPGKVAEAVLALLQSDRGRNCYMGWPEKLFVRINSILPTIVDGALGKKLRVVQQFAGKKAD